MVKLPEGRMFPERYSQEDIETWDREYNDFIMRLAELQGKHASQTQAYRKSRQEYKKSGGEERAIAKYACQAAHARLIILQEKISDLIDEHDRDLEIIKWAKTRENANYRQAYLKQIESGVKDADYIVPYPEVK